MTFRRAAQEFVTPALLALVIVLPGCVSSGSVENLDIGLRSQVSGLASCRRDYSINGELEKGTSRYEVVQELKVEPAELRRICVQMSYQRLANPASPCGGTMGQFLLFLKNGDRALHVSINCIDESSMISLVKRQSDGTYISGDSDFLSAEYQSPQFVEFVTSRLGSVKKTKVKTTPAANSSARGD